MHVLMCSMEVSQGVDCVIHGCSFGHKVWELFLGELKLDIVLEPRILFHIGCVMLFSTMFQEKSSHHRKLIQQAGNKPEFEPALEETCI